MFTIYISTLLVAAVSGPSLRAHQIESCLALGLYEEAVRQAEKELAVGDPLYIKALARSGAPEKALAIYKEGEDSLEEICWAFLEKGRRSTQLFHKWIVMQLVGDLHSYRSVPFILEALQSSNIALREAACQLVPSMQDQVLLKELKRLALHDQEMAVRLTALRALAAVQAKDASCYMTFDADSVSREKIAAITSLALLRDRVEAREVEELVKSSRALMRLFAVELVLTSNQKELMPLLLPLACDTHPTVKMAFCQAAVILRQERAPELAHDSDFRVAITAAWMRAVYGEPWEELTTFLRSGNPQARSLAAVALGLLGQKEPLIAQLKEEKERFVRLNIAASLLPFDETAEEVILESLSSYQGLLMQTTSYSPALPLILPSDLPKRELMGGDDAALQDLMVRMQLLQQLAAKNSSKAITALKGFLKEKRLGKTTLASFVLLQEGDEETAAMVEQLLHHEDEEIRLQSALLLGRLFSDPEALSVLQSHYTAADLETRLMIIEALGRIGGKESLPFLQKQLTDPSLSVQMLSAWAIITIINH